jgi:glutamine synthetase
VQSLRIGLSRRRVKRLEYRIPDPSSNGYLAFAAMLMAGLDGIENKIVPPDPIDKDLYDLEPEEKKDIASTPGSLEEALDALEADHEYLLRGDVFTKDVIDKDLYDLEPEEKKDIASTPGSLEEALDALEADHEYLLRGDVFTKDVIDTWIGYKRENEVDAVRLRPHPHEFELYYDI